MARGRLHLFRSGDRRSTLERGGRLALQAWHLARLPIAVATFWVRAMRRAQASGDSSSPIGSEGALGMIRTRPGSTS